VSGSRACTPKWAGAVNSRRQQHGDELRLAISKVGPAQRDALVLDMLRDSSIPVAIAMVGGYAEKLDDIVDIHFATVRLALRRFPGFFPV